MSILQDSQKFRDLRQRLIFLVIALIIFRIGVHIPIPGVDYRGLRALFQDSGDLLQFFNLFTGGALHNASIMAVGIFPYITAAIIMQLASFSFARIQAWKKEGTLGQQKMTRASRYLTVPLAAIQSLGFISLIEAQDLVFDPGVSFRVIGVVCMVSGSVFLLWLGERITERGIGNGISLIIFASIVSSLPSAFGSLFSQVQSGERGPFFVIAVLVGAACIFGFVVFVERGQRRVLLNYAKRQVGNKMFGGQSSYLPFKVNMAGVMPAIFAFAILAFPSTILSWVAGGEGGSFSLLREVASTIQQGTPMYFFLLGLSIIFFAFFWVSQTVQPKENADTLRKSGAFIPGIRPGEQTSLYLEKVILRLTLCGSIYIALVCLIPEAVYVSLVNFPQFFGGTSILIMVVVAMDFMENIQHYMMSQQYGSLLKKAN